ncbi:MULTISPECIES: sigma factor-like helix-turn-helix DNA-binding protein [Bacillaceae]|uniref:sigma factor-like helix-turn-helix DNA-binding protein n=1 Tax=Bacillaceae TaxID=186817 RepID=UPI001E4DE4FC|nr:MULTISPECIES: sigma factor-like helix-turn-helix DNA-binding protein [Bacillaceae]MCE4050607.1 hypothetical protein [Bacillus sp. Au-Bac7]MCM3031993.1 hypothetical protein [Niallia sp. MER 6]MDL0436002.1 sigma factor-like helix-turn-helix DNA-binding protein [Niallia sp. SS-2023]UPO87869.1 hypothetical protein L8T27_001210 [Niallia sp. Man26]
MCEESVNGLKRFIEENKEFMGNTIVQGFLREKGHFKLFADAVCYPSKENKENLDEAFKKYYFTIRFTSYISSSIHFSTLNFHRKQRLYANRYPLLLDAETEDGRTHKDRMEDRNANLEAYAEREGIRESISEYIADPLLYDAIQSLSDSQKTVLYFAYIKKLNDTEIAEVIQKSQQYVSKCHQKALQRIYSYMAQKKEDYRR